MSTKATYTVSGQTYTYKDKLKKAGAKYQPATKTWLLTCFKSDSIWRYEGKLVFTPVADKPKKHGWDKDAWNELINEGGEGYQL